MSNGKTGAWDDFAPGVPMKVTLRLRCWPAFQGTINAALLILYHQGRMSSCDRPPND
ncbi:MAG: hypothetical protein AAEI92_10160 [Arenicellales bacterium]